MRVPLLPITPIQLLITPLKTTTILHHHNVMPNPITLPIPLYDLVTRIETLLVFARQIVLLLLLEVLPADGKLWDVDDRLTETAPAAFYVEVFYVLAAHGVWLLEGGGVVLFDTLMVVFVLLLSFFVMELFTFVLQCVFPVRNNLQLSLHLLQLPLNLILLEVDGDLPLPELFL